MSIKDLIRGVSEKTPDELHKKIATLEAKITAQADLTNAANLDALDATGPTDKLEVAAVKARNELLTLEAKLSVLNSALIEAQNRVYKKKTFDDKRKAKENHEKIDELLGIRERLSQDMEVAVTNITEIHHDMSQISQQLYDLLPLPSSQKAGIQEGQITTDLRLHLNKRGMTWAHSWPWSAKNITSFANKTKETNTAILHTLERLDQ